MTVWSSSTSRRASRRTTSSPSCARRYGQRKVGHAGTLDPDATGVLLVGLGRATRLLRYLSEAGKAYEGRIVFGIATSTLDAAGEVLDQRPMPITRDDVERRAPALPRRHRAAPADGVGGEDRRSPSPRARPRRARRSSGRRARCTSTASTWSGSSPGPIPRPTSRSSAAAAPTCARWRPISAPRSVGCAHLAALRRTRVGSLHPRRVAPARRHRGRSRRRGAAARPTAMRDLERVDVDDEQARAVVARRVVRRRRAHRAGRRPVRARRSRRRACSPSTTPAAPRLRPAVVVARRS